MTIVKTYKDPTAERQTITQKEAEADLETQGYYKPGTVQEILDVGKPAMLFSPWATFDFRV